jgi:NADPH-dependent 2,4-dienoyl-CoA reductase/sulfur reductase-like enzyme/nitrite reductase/ring-hydroxylating ferredoxin subunit
MSEFNIGKATDFLKEGEMKRLDLDGTAVLVSRVEGNYYAVSGDCTHYGAPLDQGVLKGHTVMCPWHHACFDIRSGLRLEPPALNNLAHFPIEVRGEALFVNLERDNEIEPQGKADPASHETFVIVGGGAAGNAACEALRREGFRGKIIVLSDVPQLPLDRPNLSKDYLAGHADPAWMPLRPDQAWYRDRDIEVRCNTHVASVDAQAHRLILDDGSSVDYTKLLIATGAIPRQLNAPGVDLNGIFVLRNQAHADQIIGAADLGKQVVIVGASFIAMETAWALASGRGVAVTVVGIEDIPFVRVLGSDIGKMLLQEHQSPGVKFRLSAEITQFIGENGYVTGVELKSGEVLPADFVIVGVGVRPATDFLSGSPLKLDQRDKSVRVEATLRTSEPDIYAAGDIARINNNTPEGVRIEHWRVAQQHGIIAAQNMMGGSESVMQHVPFFWTHQWDVELRYVGHAETWDEIIYRGGTPQQKRFVAFYIHGGKLLAAAGVQHDAEMDAIEFILRDGMPLTREQMQDSTFDLVRYAQGG